MGKDTTLTMYDETAFLTATWAREPFPHAVIDNAWNPWVLRDCLGEFPAANDRRWVTYNDPEEVGKKAGGTNMWGEATREFFTAVRSPGFAALLEQVTGISPLTGDDIGGGMHETGTGGRLEMHVDFNIHPGDPGLERRLNMLVFLNDTWEREWGGTLLLGADRSVEVPPLFNRTVLFECSATSFHGHPDPIVGDHLRRSLACYFYAPVRAETEAAHSTLWSR